MLSSGLKVICVSIPRSGHHLLARLLLDSQGAIGSYCEMYTNKNCCRQLPCKQCEILFQKTHAFRLDVEENLPAIYLVLYRDFLHSAVSEFEITRGRGKYGDSYEDWVIFAQYRKRYWIRFMKKWVLSANSARGRVTINYNDLTSDLLGVATRVAFELGLMNFDLTKAVVAVDKEPHIQRALHQFKYYEEEYFYDLEESLSNIYAEAGIGRYIRMPTYDRRSYADYWERRAPVSAPVRTLTTRNGNSSVTGISRDR